MPRNQDPARLTSMSRVGPAVSRGRNPNITQPPQPATIGNQRSAALSMGPPWKRQEGLYRLVTGKFTQRQMRASVGGHMESPMTLPRKRPA